MSSGRKFHHLPLFLKMFSKKIKVYKDYWRVEGSSSFFYLFCKIFKKKNKVYKDYWRMEESSSFFYLFSKIFQKKNNGLQGLMSSGGRKFHHLPHPFEDALKIIKVYCRVKGSSISSCSSTSIFFRRFLKK